MKRSNFYISILFLFFLSCNGVGESSRDEGAGFQEIAIRQRMSGTISTEGEVDWYHFRAVEANTILQVRCSSETIRPDVDLLVTVYQLDSQGNRIRVYADHAPDNGVNPADLTLNVYIDQPKDIYIAVRDLLDDDASGNSYYLYVDFAEMPEENASFTQALSLNIDSDTCPSDSIGTIGDIDCFRFLSQGGVYDLHVEFSPFPDTQVQLSVDLYNDEGSRIGSQSAPDMRTHHLTHYLPEGEYFVQIDDFGRDHFDQASIYSVCVNRVSNVESNGNDTQDSAVQVNLPAFTMETEITGSLDYSEDMDWYQIDMPDASSGFRVLDLAFTGTADIEYLVNVVNGDSETVLSHIFRGGSSEYRTRVKLEAGNYYLMIQPRTGQASFQTAPYTATVRVLNVQDDADALPNENDTIITADQLNPTSDPASATTGKIGYRGDVDWYYVNITAHTQPQILEVFLAAPISLVEYALSVMNTQLEKKIYKMKGETRATNLKTSLLIPGNDGDVIYSFKVHDFQDDDGDDISYDIRVDLKDIPLSLPVLTADTPPFGETVEYYIESAESSTESVTLEYNAVTRKTFYVNTSLLNVEGAVISENTPETGETTITFPWIAGYVDYQGDQDWFKIDFSPLDDSDNWYYEIRADFYAPSSDIEYVWKFYPDRNDNSILADQISDYDGFVASAGDTSTTEEAINIVTPAADDDAFWVGRSWQGQSFFSISDFNYLGDLEGNENLEPDDDWGSYGIAPYYLKVTLVYHPGESSP